MEKRKGKMGVEIWKGTGRIFVMRALGLISFSALILASGAFSQTNGLTHRYSFNDGTANDSVGNANGNLFNGASISGGQLIISGTGTGSSVQYMSMPAYVIPAASTQFTIVQWFTSSNSATWGRAFDFGSSETNNFFFTPRSSVANTSRLRITQSGGLGETGPIGGPNLNDNTEHMIAAVLDQSNNFIAYYLDGNLQSSVALGANSVSGLLAVNNSIGRSQYSADGGFGGRVSEFRIYDRALSGSEINTSYVNGANVVPEPSALSLLAVGMGGLAIMRSRRK